MGWLAWKSSTDDATRALHHVRNAFGRYTPDKFWGEHTWKRFEHEMLLYARQRRTGGVRFPLADKDFLLFALRASRHRLHMGARGPRHEPPPFLDMPLPAAEAWLETHFHQLDFVHASDKPEPQGQQRSSFALAGLHRIAFRADTTQADPLTLDAYCEASLAQLVNAWKDKGELEGLSMKPPPETRERKTPRTL